MARKKKAPFSVETQAPQQEREITFFRPLESVPIFYSNQALITTSQVDVRIVHCQVLKTDEKSMTTDPQVVTYMPIDHARRVAKILTDQLAQYDEQFKKSNEAKQGS